MQLSLESFFFCTESKMISKKVGEDVTLSCTNLSVNVLQWKLNGENLFSVKEQPNKTDKILIIKNNISKTLGLEILNTTSQLYALIIKNTKKSHEGNYTCVVTDDSGVFEESWELTVTGEQNLHNLPIQEQNGTGIKLHVLKGSQQWFMFLYSCTQIHHNYQSTLRRLLNLI